MSGFESLWLDGDAITSTVALLLILMSVCTWVMVFWKAWLLRRVRTDIQNGVPAFWAAPGLAAARERLTLLDREKILMPLVNATTSSTTSDTLESSGRIGSQLTRRLRVALRSALAHLQFGQVLLASIGSTAPFVGLFGTVWAIYHALVSISVGGAMTIEKVSGPVGEALVMTAGGLAVAIPAVLAYNIFNKMLGACEAELEGFAHDLRELVADTVES